MLSRDDVKQMIEGHIPESACEVTDLTGTSDHFAVYVTSPAFRGKSLIQQHKMVYAAVGEHLTREIHALSIKTELPEES